MLVYDTATNGENGKQTEIQYELPDKQSHRKGNYPLMCPGAAFEHAYIGGWKHSCWRETPHSVSLIPEWQGPQEEALAWLKGSGARAVVLVYGQYWSFCVPLGYKSSRPRLKHEWVVWK